MQDKKKIVIGTLCALIMIMAVGYALLSQQLSINGTANITSTWRIEITNITEKERHGGVTEKSKSYDAMTANFNVGFTSPGDYIIYDVEVTNSGTLDAVIERINVVTNDNPAIIYTTSGIKRGDVIAKNSKKYLTVKIEYDSSTTSQPQTNNNGLTLQLFTEQDLGQVQVYEAYSIGDKITYKGDEWYVIKDSTEDEDYITIIKGTVLTATELGNYSHNNSNRMAYYWDDYCHMQNAYGYTSSIYSGCVGHSDYAGSKVKEVVEKYLYDYLDETEIKRINGYKIRLIEKDELVSLSNGNYYTANGGSSYFIQQFPTWLTDFDGITYWTMTSYGSSSNYSVFIANKNKNVYPCEIENIVSVRPVINLLKSAIE